MRIVLDAMGSDDCPEPEVQAAIEAVSLFGDEILLVGPEDQLRLRLAALGGGDKIRVVHAPDTITMEDKGMQLALKAKRKGSKTSMAVGMDLVINGQGDAFVTAGNTGGAMATAYFRMGTIQGVERPGLAGLFPVKDGFCVVLDIGANPEVAPENLLQFGIMGSVYAQKVRQIPQPRLGLLSNGEEAGKGNDLVKHAYPLLEQSGLNFIGNVEGKELFGGQADVVVTDGFTGNILLKASEAVAKLIVDVMKEQLKSSPRAMLGGLLAKPALTKLRSMLNPDEIGAAPLLGVNGLVFIGHGRSNAHAMLSAIRTARQAVAADLMGAMTDAIQEALATSRPGVSA